ncbi:MAG: hypothetical protein Q9205_007723 [Flavoplaca limonia]
MRPSNLLCAFIAFASSAVAIPAVGRIPTAIDQAAANAGPGPTLPNMYVKILRSTGIKTSNRDRLPPPGPSLQGADHRFPIPDTNTVLNIILGAPLDRASLQILFGRLQLELGFLIVRYGPQGVPKVSRPGGPGYSFSTTTPQGKMFSFYLNAFRDHTLNYAMISEVVSGLKLFMVEERHFSDVRIRVETLQKLRATGGLSQSKGPGPSLTKYVYVQQVESGNPRGLILPFSDSFPLTLDIGSPQIELKCTWGPDLSRDAINDVLEDARTKIRVMTLKAGLDALMPGDAGEWSTEGKLEAKFSIAGIPPAHLTWGNMADAVKAFADLSFNGLASNGVNEKEATCEVREEYNVIGTLKVTRGDPSVL